MAGETYAAILKGLEAYYIETTSITNPLDAGPYHLLSDVQVLTGFDPALHTMSVVTDADEIRALKIVVAKGGFAVFAIYDASEDFAGYLKIEDGSNHLMPITNGTVTGEKIIGDTGVEDADFCAAALVYVATDVGKATFEETDQITDAITLAKGKCVFAIE